MKKEVVLLILVMVFSILNLQIVLADTTFFEGDYDYRNDFIMSNLPEEVVEAIAEEGVEVLQVGGGGYFVEEKFNASLVCSSCTESLRQHIKEYQDIEYDEEEIIILTEGINQEHELELSNNQVRYIIENFEEECDASYPLLGGFAGGRFRDLTNPFVLGIAIIVLLFFVIIGYLIIRVVRKVKFKTRKKKKGNRL